MSTYSSQEPSRRRKVSRFGPAPGWPMGERPEHRHPVIRGTGGARVYPGELDLTVPHSGPQDFEARLLTGDLHEPSDERLGGTVPGSITQTWVTPLGTAKLAEAYPDDLEAIERRCLDPQPRRRASYLPFGLRVPSRVLWVAATIGGVALGWVWGGAIGAA